MERKRMNKLFFFTFVLIGFTNVTHAEQKKPVTMLKG